MYVNVYFHPQHQHTSTTMCVDEQQTAVTAWHSFKHTPHCVSIPSGRPRIAEAPTELFEHFKHHLNHMVQQASNPCSLSTMTNITQTKIPQAHTSTDAPQQTNNVNHHNLHTAAELLACVSTSHNTSCVDKPHQHPTQQTHQFTRSSNACTVRCHTPLVSVPANAHATTAHIARQRNTRQTHSTSTRAQP